jgi:diacylglycerol kinase family enzyme
MLLNPLATRLRKTSRPALEHFTGLLKARLKGVADMRVRITHEFESLSDIRRDLERVAPRLVISLGGDGTASHLVDCVYKTYAASSVDLPYFLFLPGGQFNIVSNSIKTALTRWKNGLEFTENAARLLAEGREDRLDIYNLYPLKVRLDQRELHCFNVSFLNGPELLTDIYAVRHDRSKFRWGASQILGLIKRALDVETLSIRYGDGPHWRSITVPDSTLFMASTVNEIAFGLKLCHRAQERPGFFHLVTADRNPERRTHDFIKLATLDLLRVYLNKDGSFRRTDLVTDRAEVRWTDRSRAYHVSIDGELFDLEKRPYMASSLKLETARRPLRAIVNYS